MTIEFYKSKGRCVNRIAASLRKHGQIGLSSGAVKKYDVKNGELVLLGYDREKKMVAIKRLQEWEAGSRIVRLKGSSGSIAAEEFMEYFKIRPKETMPYYLQEDNGMLIFTLSEALALDTIDNDARKAAIAAAESEG